MGLRLLQFDDQLVLRGFFLIELANRLNQFFLVDGDVRSIDNGNADLLDCIVGILDGQEGAVLLHRIHPAGNRAIVVETEKVRTLLPGGESVILENEDTADFLFQPLGGQFRKTLEEIAPDQLFRRTAAIRCHELIPQRDTHFTINDEYAHLQPVDQKIQHGGDNGVNSHQ